MFVKRPIKIKPGKYVVEEVSTYFLSVTEKTAMVAAEGQSGNW